MRVLVTGGAGFIGSAVIRLLMEETSHEVLNVDCLTYASNLANLDPVQGNGRYRFLQADIADAAAIGAAFATHAPEAVIHLAAETHVDRSIDRPAPFIHTNVVGTQVLLDAALAHWRGLKPEAQHGFRFVHVSTDEVFGSLGPTGLFAETMPYAPNSPYAASKAAADHLVRAWHHTFGLPIMVSIGSNTYGPYQHPEKLIPLMTLRALRREPLPIYGHGDNIRDWLYVDDHARALLAVLDCGQIGHTYLIGGRSERRNVDVVHAICDALDARMPLAVPSATRRELITFVPDRPGHDFRYALDTEHSMAELGWRPELTFEQGLVKTIDWYLASEDWWRPIVDRGDTKERLGRGG